MPTMTDFSRAYMTWSVPHRPGDTRVPGHKPWGNWARILLDARGILFDATLGTSDEFFLIVPCRTEWMYQEADLFQMPSGEYRGIWSRTRTLRLGKRLTEEEEAPHSTPVEDEFTSLVFSVPTLPGTTVLNTDEEVVAATRQNLPLVAQTTIWDDSQRFSATIEYPIKTMNFHPERNRFQVDTGPVLLPDFSLETEHWIDRFSLAHVVYNTFDRAEFIIRRPTPILREGQRVATVLHYSEKRIHAARHTILCAGHI